MMRKISIIIFILTLIFSANVSVFAEETSAVTETAETAYVNKDTLIIKTGRLNSTEGQIEGTGGVTLLKEDVEVTGERLLYFEREKRAEISGGVNLVHEKGEITSNYMEAFIEDDKYIFQEEVEMLQRLADGDFNLKSPYLELLKVDNSFQAAQ